MINIEQIKQTDLDSLNFLALKAITEMKKNPEYKKQFEEWKKKKAPSDQR
nr:MAG TPA: hypothetical protein [Bacteriophage sp.]